MIEIQNANATIMVTDMDTAIKFYIDTLGLKLKSRYGNHWADVEAPGMAIGLHPTSKKINPGDNIQIALKVTDLEKAVSLLESKGVTFSYNNEDQVRLAFFNDPDGNRLYLVA